jgi:SAM-dependent methyltransferase
MAAPVTSTFDPIAYKATTQEQWQAAAEAWHRWGPTIEQWLGEATESMLDLAGVGEGARVLDVAAGAGGQTLTPARRVGPAGRVLASDIAPGDPGLRRGRGPPSRAGQRGHPGHGRRAARRRSRDLRRRHLEGGAHLLPRPAARAQRVRRSLRPGGRVAAIVYSTPDRNQFFSLPVSIIRRRAQLPPFAPGQPGPFSLGGPGLLEEAFTAAGFHDVVTRLVPAPLQLASASDCVRFEQESFGALHQMLAGLDEPGREAAWTEIAEALAQFEGSSGFKGPCEMLVAAGTK